MSPATAPPLCLLPQLPPLCAGGAFCPSCRDTSRTGEEWRASVRGVGLLPIACPRGLPWSDGTPPAPAPAMPTGPSWQERARSLWALFHGRPLVWAGEDAERRWLAWFESQLRELGCTCRSNWTTLERQVPLDLSSPLAYARSSWGRHERVNADLGKPPFTWDEAVQTHHWEGLIDGPSTAGRSTIEGR